MGKKPVVGPRMTAEIEGDFAVFMTGMRVNNFFKVKRWLPTFWSMGGVLKAMWADQETTGALHAHAYWGNRGAVMIVYFRSIEHLERFANNRELAHSKALQDYFRRMKDNPAVGIWHESYVVHDGEYEAVYNHMPEATGLAAAGECVPVSRRGNSASARRATGAQVAARAVAAPGRDLDPVTPVVDEIFPAAPADRSAA
ncbi:monooxygenase family protein [Micromonospora rifamycinica]|uniref:DUF4188 domain-containing protein n=1 Tax=Micromonospora rifamycinica TaxID=291594 RepID=A0A1C5HQN2_9ACTN|nr:DUF4188 domain-containing protein [Micromonospora rifamycinica]SCG48292.1 protein of unknown function [Micromonospora rifamycinica]